MANDLISRKALMQEIEKSMNNNPHIEPKVKVNHEQEHKHFMRLLSKQPTAYNVDKVVEELEMLSTEVKMILPFSKEAIETKVIASGEAIEIIRRGGVE